jgi:glycine/D-amino acid oxidase-like deaminating enzyme
VLGQEAHVVPRDRLREEIGSDVYFGGLVVEKSGGLHPARFHAGIARAAMDAGAQVHEHTEAVGVARNAVTTPRGTIRCGEVLVATNGYTRTAPVPWLRRRILPIGSYIIATEELAPELAREISPRRRMFFDTKNFLYYWRLSPDGRRVLFGGRTSFAPTTVERSRERLYASMVRVHPQLEGVPVEFAWGGNVALTVDRYPHLGRHDGVTYAMGYCGTGVAASTHFGRLAGRWLAGAGELGVFADREWRRVPAPGRVDRLLPVGGWWYEWQDRRD